MLIVNGLIGLGIVGISSYVLLCLVVYAYQTRLIFFPNRELTRTPALFGISYEEVLCTIPGNPQATLHGWWLSASGTAPYTVLYLHGNSQNISGGNLEQAVLFHRLGLDVLMMDYRGYGQSSGPFPSEQRLYADAAMMWQHLTCKRNIPPAQILVYGHSLGGAIAVELACHQPQMAGLIIQSSFTSMTAMASRLGYRRFLPIRWLLTQRFNSLEKLARLRLPILLIHGLADSSVPADMSRQLYQVASEPKELYLVPAAEHNNVAGVAGDEYNAVIHRFLHVVQQYLQTSQER